MWLAAMAIKRPIFITCVVFLMLIVGLLSLSRMPVDQFPDVTFPIVFVQVPYPGASPVDIEKQVVKPIEDELGSLPGLDKLNSNSMESVGLLILQFKLGTDIKESEQNVRNRLSNIRSTLPTEIKEPIIRRFDPADQPVITLAAQSTLEPGEFFDAVNEVIKPQFERLKDIGQVQVVGGRKTEIQVLINKDKLQDRKISLLQVSQRIAETSKDVPIGKVDDAKNELVMRTSGEFSGVSQLNKVSVNFLGSDRPVLLEEIATVRKGLEDQKRIAKINGKNALFIEVYKQNGTNTVAVVDAVKKNVANVNEYLKTKNIKVEVNEVRDLSRVIRLNIADVRESIIIGIILCIIVVFFFLGSVRSTFITGMALPNSLIGGFIIMYAMGFSINILTLLALSLAVGLLIDDAIVVRENIFRHMEMGKDPKTAALEGTTEVAQAVIATTLVVIAVFGPISFLDGIVGQFFKQFGLTVVFTMLISLFDAFTVAPMLSAYMASPVEHGPKKGFLGMILGPFDRFQAWLEDLYESTLKIVLFYKKTTLSLALGIFIGSMMLVGGIPKTFLPQADNGEFGVNIELPTGTSLEASRVFAEELEKQLTEDSRIDLVTTVVGSSNSEANKSSMFVRLKPRGKLRKESSTELKDHFREVFSAYKEKAIISVGDIDIGGNNQKPLLLNLTGDNLDELAAYATKLQARIAKIDGLVDVGMNFRSGKPEYHVTFDRNKSERLGVSTVNVGAELRGRTEGIESAVYREKGIEYKIRTRLEEKSRDLRETFSTTLVPNQNFNMIPLNRIATGETTQGYSQINRQNKSRFIQIDANLGKGGSLGTASDVISEVLKKELPPPPGVDASFQGQAKDFAELMANMMIAMALGILFIYLVLSSLYESFITPITILLALPLAMSGAMAALRIFGKTIDIFSLIGIILLLGVVAKNSILLVDYTVQLIAQGYNRYDALIKASRTRLRPILMTSFALAAGILPIAIGLTELGTQRSSMGVAIIGGVVSSTLLTLLVVPAAFGYIDDFRLWCLKIALALKGETAGSAPAHSGVKYPPQDSSSGLISSK